VPAPHPPEFRRRAVELARQKTKPVAELAKELRISESCLRNWMAQADVDEASGTPPSRPTKHYLAAVSNAQRVLFHLEIVDQLPRSGGPVPFAERLAEVHPAVRATMIAYLERKRASCQPKTVSGIATRLKHFGVFLARIDPGLDSIAHLDRRIHRC
jgi:transposase-like protein